MLYTLVRTWKQPRCPSTDEWRRKLWYIYTMEYYSAIKKEHVWVSSTEVDETGAYYAEWSKPERKTPIQYTNTIPHWVLQRCTSAAERSYPMSEVRGGSQEELPCVQGHGWRPRVPGCDSAGAAKRRYPMPEVRGSSWERDSTSPFWRRSSLGFLWK